MLLVADSFRTRASTDGTIEARGFTRHVDRFARTVGAVLATDFGQHPDTIATALSRFLPDALAEIVGSGAGFPRLELWGGGQAEPRFAVSIRPLPELGETVDMRTASRVGAVTPDRKGPNIAAYGELRALFSAEPLLCDPHAPGDADASRAVEGATTSLIWWEEGRGHFVDRADRVASVTEAILRDAAELTPAPATVARLCAAEVWAVNALHGIRPVTRIDGVDLPSAEPERLATHRAHLDVAWEPVRG